MLRFGTPSQVRHLEAQSTGIGISRCPGLRTRGPPIRGPPVTVAASGDSDGGISPDPSKAGGYTDNRDLQAVRQQMERAGLGGSFDLLMHGATKQQAKPGRQRGPAPQPQTSGESRAQGPHKLDAWGHGHVQHEGSVAAPGPRDGPAPAANAPPGALQQSAAQSSSAAHTAGPEVPAPQPAAAGAGGSSGGAMRPTTASAELVSPAPVDRPASTNGVGSVTGSGPHAGSLSAVHAGATGPSGYASRAGREERAALQSLAADAARRTAGGALRTGAAARAPGANAASGATASASPAGALGPDIPTADDGAGVELAPSSSERGDNLGAGPPDSVEQAWLRYAARKEKQTFRVEWYTSPTFLANHIDTGLCKRGAVLSFYEQMSKGHDLQMGKGHDNQELFANCSKPFLHVRFKESFARTVMEEEAFKRRALEREKHCEDALVAKGFVDLSPRAEESSLAEFMSRAGRLPRGQPAYARQLTLGGVVGCAELNGRMDFLLLLWDEDTGAPLLRVVECKDTTATKTSHDVQAALYGMLILDELFLWRKQQQEQQQQAEAAYRSVWSDTGKSESLEEGDLAEAGSEALLRQGSSGASAGPRNGGPASLLMMELSPARIECVVIRLSADDTPDDPLLTLPLNGLQALQDDVSRRLGPDSDLSRLYQEAEQALAPQLSTSTSGRCQGVGSSLARQLLDEQPFSYSGKCRACPQRAFCIADSWLHGRPELLGLRQADTTLLRSSGFSKVHDVAGLNEKRSDAAQLVERGLTRSVWQLQADAEVAMRLVPQQGGTATQAPPPQYTAEVSYLEGPFHSTLPPGVRYPQATPRPLRLVRVFVTGHYDQSRWPISALNAHVNASMRQLRQDPEQERADREGRTSVPRSGRDVASIHPCNQSGVYEADRAVDRAFLEGFFQDLFSAMQEVGRQAQAEEGPEAGEAVLLPFHFFFLSRAFLRRLIDVIMRCDPEGTSVTLKKALELFGRRNGPEQEAYSIIEEELGRQVAVAGLGRSLWRLASLRWQVWGHPAAAQRFKTPIVPVAIFKPSPTGFEDVNLVKDLRLAPVHLMSYVKYGEGAREWDVRYVDAHSDLSGTEFAEHWFHIDCSGSSESLDEVTFFAYQQLQRDKEATVGGHDVACGVRQRVEITERALKRLQAVPGLLKQEPHALRWITERLAPDWNLVKKAEDLSALASARGTALKPSLLPQTLRDYMLVEHSMKLDQLGRAMLEVPAARAKTVAVRNVRKYEAGEQEVGSDPRASPTAPTAQGSSGSGHSGGSTKRLGGGSRPRGASSSRLYVCEVESTAAGGAWLGEGVQAADAPLAFNEGDFVRVHERRSEDLNELQGKFIAKGHAGWTAKIVCAPQHATGAGTLPGVQAVSHAGARVPGRLLYLEPIGAVGDGGFFVQKNSPLAEYAYATLDESPSDFTKWKVDARLETTLLDNRRSRFLTWLANGGLVGTHGPVSEQHEALAPLLDLLRTASGKALQPEQRDAILQGLFARCQVVQGPPGTGKTQVLALAVLLRAMDSARTRPPLPMRNGARLGRVVLLVANTKAAVRVALERLAGTWPGMREAADHLGVKAPTIEFANLLSSKAPAAADGEGGAADPVASGSGSAPDTGTISSADSSTGDDDANTPDALPIHTLYFSSRKYNRAASLSYMYPEALDDLRADGRMVVVGTTVSCALKLAGYLEANQSPESDPWVTCPLGLLAVDEASMMPVPDLVALLSLFPAPLDMAGPPGQGEAAGDTGVGVAGDTHARGGSSHGQSGAAAAASGGTEIHSYGPGNGWGYGGTGGTAGRHVALLVGGNPRQLPPITAVDKEEETRPAFLASRNLLGSAYDFLAATPGTFLSRLRVSHRFGSVTAGLLREAVYQQDGIAFQAARGREQGREEEPAPEGGATHASPATSHGPTAPAASAPCTSPSGAPSSSSSTPGGRSGGTPSSMPDGMPGGMPGGMPAAGSTPGGMAGSMPSAAAWGAARPRLAPLLSRVWGEAGGELFLVVHDEARSRERNEVEVQLVRELLHAAPAGSLGAGSTGVITTRTRQRTLLKSMLAADPAPGNPAAMAAVDVDTVERFQGGERHNIVISACTSSAADLDANPEFYFSPGRQAVMFSRHRRRLVLVASDALLDHMPADAEQLRAMALYKALRALASRLIGECTVSDVGQRLGRTAAPAPPSGAVRVRVYGVDPEREAELQSRLAALPGV